MSNSGDVAGEQSGQVARDTLDALPTAARAVIVDELTRRDPALLAELRNVREPTTEQSDAVNRLLASAIVESMDPDWTPNEHGLAVERAVTTYFEVWPLYR
jgi:hypothetical protein